MATCEVCEAVVPRGSVVTAEGVKFCSELCGKRYLDGVTMECVDCENRIHVYPQENYPRLCPECGGEWELDHEWQKPFETKSDKV